MKMEAEMKGCGHKPRNVGSHQKLEEAGKGSAPETSEGACVLSQPVRGDLLESPQDTSTPTNCLSFGETLVQLRCRV